MAFLTPDPRHLGRADGLVPRRDAPLPPAAKYRRWDGSQDVPDLTADEIVDALADDVLEHGDVGEALRRLMERGLRANDPSRARSSTRSRTTCSSTATCPRRCAT